MAVTLGFYSDAALTVKLAGLPLRMAADGQRLAARFWLGSPDPGTFNSGSPPLQLAPLSAGSGEPIESIRLARTEAALETAPPGGALELPTPLQGGAENALEIWVRWDHSGSNGAWSNVSLTLGEVIQI